MDTRVLTILGIILIALYSCTTSKPKSMLEFYYSVPFGDKYNDALSREAKEKLFNAGEWEALEDSGYAKLISNIDDEMYSEEIIIRVWNDGDLVAITTFYDEGSDCPPIHELNLFRYNGKDWNPVEVPALEVSHYWSDPGQVPEAVSKNSELIEFEPYLDKKLNGIRFEWRYYTCQDGSVEDVPDYFENENRELFHAGSDQRDFDDLIYLWDTNFSSLEKSQALTTRVKADDNSHQTARPGIGLLLGTVANDGPTTYFVTFSDNRLKIKSLNDAILSPQHDNFYIIQTIGATSTKTCSYEDDDGETKEEECTSSASKLLISQADQNEYHSEYSFVNREVSAMASAKCGYDEGQFEDISFIGKNFIQFVRGGSDSECAPGGPGGGFEKDTIVSFNGDRISLLAKSYLNYSDLHLAYDKLFAGGETKNIPGFCEPDEMLISLTHEDGSLTLHTRNNSGRGYQDSWERDVKFSEAPDVFKTKEYKTIQNKEILNGSTDHFVSPNGRYVVVVKNINEEQRLYFHDVNNPIAIARISIPNADIVMEEWCDMNYWSKWDKAVEDASGYIKIRNPD